MFTAQKMSLTSLQTAILLRFYPFCKARCSKETRPTHVPVFPCSLHTCVHVKVLPCGTGRLWFHYPRGSAMEAWCKAVYGSGILILSCLGMALTKSKWEMQRKTVRGLFFLPCLPVDRCLYNCVWLPFARNLLTFLVTNLHLGLFPVQQHDRQHRNTQHRAAFIIILLIIDVKTNCSRINVSNNMPMVPWGASNTTQRPVVVRPWCLRRFFLLWDIWRFHQLLVWTSWFLFKKSTLLAEVWMQIWVFSFFLTGRWCDSPESGGTHSSSILLPASASVLIHLMWQ